MKRVEEGRYKGKEWDSIVKVVIEKWGVCSGCLLRLIVLTKKIGAFVKGYVRDE
jgi:hypothetical protein